MDIYIYTPIYYRIHKPGVPRGPASPQRLGPSIQHATHGPALESKQQARRAIQSPTGRSGQGGGAPVFRLRTTSPTGVLTSVSSRLWTVSPTGRPGKALPPTPTPHLRPGYAKTLLTALLRPAQLEPTGTNRPGTPSWKGPGNEWRKARQGA